MTPDYRIVAEGRDITATLRSRLLALGLTDEAGHQLDRLEMTLDDRSPGIDLPRVGVELDVALGYAEQPPLTRMGLYVVDDIELAGPPGILKVRAKGAAFVSSKKYRHLQTQQSRSWDNVTLGDLVRIIAAEHGYQPVVAERFETMTYPNVQQSAESSLNLLARLATDQGGVIKPTHARLLCIEESAGRRAGGERTRELLLRPGDVTRWRVNLTQRQRFASVRARWHDLDKAETLSVTAGKGEPVYEMTYLRANRQAAWIAADSLLKKFQRGASTLSLTLPGNVDLMAGSRLKLEGFRPGADGQWVCQRAEHHLGDAGFVTRIGANILLQPASR